MVTSKLKGAHLKLDNAAIHIAKANELLEKKRPFTYVLETNTQTRKRATFAKENEAVTDELAVVCGDVFCNLRTALDFAYWQIVSPHVSSEKQRRNIQFPFCKRRLAIGDDKGLEETITNRFADKVSPEFCDAIRSLKPYGEAGGNRLLYALEKAAMPERHSDYTPIGDYTRIDADMIRAQIQDFPSYLGGTFVFGSNRRDFVWDAGRIDIRERQIGSLVPGSFNVFEKELDVPVDVLFKIAEADYKGPVIPTLNQFSNVVREVLIVFEPFA